MKKFDIIVSDPPWSFSDKLTMAPVKRGASSQYSTLNLQAIKNLPVQKVVSKDAVLVLWVPGSLLQEGLDVMSAWGFNQKQIHVWVKTKKEPFEGLYKVVPNITNAFKPLFKLGKNVDSTDIKKIATDTTAIIRSMFAKTDFSGQWKLDDILAFGMGRLFRQTHEIALIGTRGNVYTMLKNKSQRSVHFGPVLKHSAKPEDLQDMLDVMFPGASKLELFARRERSGWVCLGNQCPTSYGEDIRDSLNKFISKDDIAYHDLSIQEQVSLYNKFKISIKESKLFSKQQIKYLINKLK